MKHLLLSLILYSCVITVTPPEPSELPPDLWVDVGCRYQGQIVKEILIIEVTKYTKDGTPKNYQSVRVWFYDPTTAEMNRFDTFAIRATQALSMIGIEKKNDRPICFEK